MILFLVFLAICIYCYFTAEPEKPAEQIRVSTIYDAEKAEQDRKQSAKKAQAAEDQAFFERKLPILHEMLDAANDSLAHANASLEYAELANRESGAAVVSGKQIDTWKKEREKALKQIMSLEGQIHAAEARIEKAKYIVKYGG